MAHSTLRLKMKYCFSLLLVMLTFAMPSFAQPFVVTGSVTDTLNANPLQMASVVLMRTSDSVIETYARTNAEGKFTATVRTKGKYFLRVSFPSFADYVDNINITKSNTNLGDLPMVSKSFLLKEFVLTQQVSAIKIKGDTTEYMADSFKVRDGANVEDLLKKLPGIQVDKNGQITAQGETVERILVDGEEFFSDDPKVVTRGLQADAVKKVQVYDKKSDQAEFTGVDDGQKTKTINLELKEEKKKGYFGKADAGGGSDGYFQNQAMINAFRAKRQFSAFGIAANTDKAGLGWEDSDKFGSGKNNTMITDDGSIVSYFNQDDDDIAGWNGRYTGEGLPSTWTAGAHYADKLADNKHHINANYRFARQNVDIDGNTENQFTLPGDSLRITAMNKNQFSTSDRHGLDIGYDWKIDSNTSLKVSVDAGQKSSNTQSKYTTLNYYKTLDAPDTSVNTRTINSANEAQFINADFLLRRKFAKKGRTLSIDGKENFKLAEGNGNLLSTIAQGPSSVSIDQLKENSSSTLAFSGKAVYTEPLSKKLFMELSYGLTVNNSTAANKTYDVDTNGGRLLNNFFSSDYTFNIRTNSGGLNFRFVLKNANISFGSDVARIDYTQIDHLRGDSERKYHFVNLFPRVSYTYRFGKQTSLTLGYNGNTQQPSITQIQPLAQNIDPLNITIGNPNLQQEFVHRLSARFNDYKILQNRYMWASINFSSISDAISTEQFFDGPVNTTRYINVDGNYNSYGYFGYGRKIGKSDFMIGGQIDGSLYQVNNKINGQLNKSDNRAIFVGPYLSYNKEEKFDMRWNPSIAYNTNTASVNGTEVSYYILSNSIDATLQLPKKIQVGTEVSMNFRQKTEIFNTNNNVIKWDAFVEKKFLKKNQLVIRASVFDILNQNLGFSRSAQGNIVTQNSYNTIRRYGMLNLIWNFTHTPAGAPAGEQNGPGIKL